jgi:hypothetical protein
LTFVKCKKRILKKLQTFHAYELVTFKLYRLEGMPGCRIILEWWQRRQFGQISSSIFFRVVTFCRSGENVVSVVDIAFQLA